jgi:hypothetical protein
LKESKWYVTFTSELESNMKGLRHKLKKNENYLKNMVCDKRLNVSN